MHDREIGGNSRDAKVKAWPANNQLVIAGHAVQNVPYSMHVKYTAKDRKLSSSSSSSYMPVLSYTFVARNARDVASNAFVCRRGMFTVNTISTVI